MSIETKKRIGMATMTISLVSGLALLIVGWLYAGVNKAQDDAVNALQQTATINGKLDGLNSKVDLLIQLTEGHRILGAKVASSTIDP